MKIYQFNLYPEEEAELRAEFEKQHAGRNLTRHSLRGTYFSAPIAALWVQHVRTYLWIQEKYEQLEKATTVSALSYAERLCRERVDRVDSSRPGEPQVEWAKGFSDGIATGANHCACEIKEVLVKVQSGSTLLDLVKEHEAGRSEKHSR